MACSCSRSHGVDIASLPLPHHTRTRACISSLHNKPVSLPRISIPLVTSSSPAHAQRRLAKRSSHNSLGFISCSFAASPSRFRFSPSEIERLTQIRLRSEWEMHASDEDYEIEEMIEFDNEEKDDEDENDLQDFETDYDIGRLGDLDRYQERDTFISTRGEAAESVVDYKINEDEFHKLSLQHCDFFIRKVPDKDNDVYDFREMYVTAPDTDIYAIPKVDDKLPKKPVRFMMSKFEHVVVTELPVEALRSPMVKNEMQVMKIFLIKHYKNRRTDAWNFGLDFEQILVIDSKTRSISRAKVTSQRKTPSQVILERQWNKTKKDMDNYLRSFRDYPVSNWF